MAATALFAIGDASASDWQDSSGNNTDATATGTPVLGTEDGKNVVELDGGVEYYATGAVPAPTTSATFLFVAKVAPGSITYDIYVFMRGTGFVGGLIRHGASEHITYLWGGIYDSAAKVSPSTEIALYAMVCNGTHASATTVVDVYKIDSGGTTKVSNTAVHVPYSAENTPLYLGHDPVFAGRNPLMDVRHWEYHRNIALTQAELEAIYTAVMAADPDSTPPSDVTGLGGTASSSTQADLDWTDATDNIAVTDYRVFYNTANNHTGESQVDVGSAVSAKNVTGLTPGTTYYFWVKAKDAAGNFSTNYSSVHSIAMPGLAPEAAFTIPAELEASDPLIPDNTSLYGDTYQWKVNGVDVSTEFEPDLTIYLIMGENTVRLTVTNEEGSDFVEHTVTVVAKYINVGNVTTYLLENLSDGLTLTGCSMPCLSWPSITTAWLKQSTNWTQAGCCLGNDCGCRWGQPWWTSPWTWPANRTGTSDRWRGMMCSRLHPRTLFLGRTAMRILNTR